MKLTIEELELKARDYFLHGGGGFEDGARAVSFTFSGMVDMAAAFAEYMLEFEMNLKCKEHPRYQMKRQPRGNCEACWFLYFLKNEGGYSFDKDFSEVRCQK